MINLVGAWMKVYQDSCDLISLHGHYFMFCQLNLNLRICLNLRFTFNILPSILTLHMNTVVHNTNKKKKNSVIVKTTQANM